MLPVQVTLRRLGRLVAPAASLARRSALRPAAARLDALGAFPQLRRQQAAAFASLSSDAAGLGAVSAFADEDDGEDDELVLEPLPEQRQAGFAGQQPLADFDLSPALMRNLDKAGITHLFPVQVQSFSTMLAGSDILGRSKTGSGKTLAFALPIIEKTLAAREASPSSRDPRALILLPTRELAQQVTEEIKRVSPQLRTVDIVGGVSYTLQENRLRRGVDIVVGTPGRIMDLVNKGSLSLDSVQTSVLDEADMMLKFGFQEAVETILGWAPEDQQCVMWSATFPSWVKSMSRKFLKNPVSIDLVGRDDNHVPTTVAHKAIHAPVNTRVDLLENVLRHHANGGQCLVFTETKQEADEIANRLGKQEVRALHGDLSQGMRTSTMEGFRSGSVQTLVCTDIAARGLDIANVDLVVQFRLPSDKESFVHRAGRTGRAGRSGTNIVFFDRQDAQDVLDFEKRYHFTFNQVAPPAADQVVDSAVNDVTERLKTLPVSSARLFEEAAQQLLNEQGVGALSSALAILCGFDNKRIQSISMINGRPRMQTVEVEGVDSARELNRILSSFSGDGSRYDIHPIEDKLVFDVPHGSLGKLREHFAASGREDVEIAPASELPRVLIDKRAPNRNNNGGSGNSRFSRDRSSSSTSFKRGGNGSNRSSGRNFDSSFSRGRSNSNSNSFNNNDRRQRSKSSSGSKFGRYSESSSRGDRWSKSW